MRSVSGRWKHTRGWFLHLCVTSLGYTVVVGMALSRYFSESRYWMFHYLLDTSVFWVLCWPHKEPSVSSVYTSWRTRKGCRSCNVIDFCRLGHFARLWLVLLLPWKRRFLGHQFTQFCTAQTSYMSVYCRPFRCVCPGFVSECEGPLKVWVQYAAGW